MILLNVNLAVIGQEEDVMMEGYSSILVLGRHTLPPEDLMVYLVTHRVLMMPVASNRSQSQLGFEMAYMEAATRI